MAELLIKAKENWMESLSKEEIKALPKEKKDRYNARSKKGDIVAVKPDGWQWGKMECLPSFIVVKMPGKNVEEVEHLTESLYDSTSSPKKPKLLKHRKFTFSERLIKTQVDANKSVVEFKTNLEQQVAMSLLTEMTEDKMKEETGAAISEIDQ